MKKFHQVCENPNCRQEFFSKRKARFHADSCRQFMYRQRMETAANDAYYKRIHIVSASKPYDDTEESVMSLLLPSLKSTIKKIDGYPKPPDDTEESLPASKPHDDTEESVMSLLLPSITPSMMNVGGYVTPPDDGKESITHTVSADTLPDDREASVMSLLLPSITPSLKNTESNVTQPFEAKNQ